MSEDITLNILSETVGYHKGALAVLAKERNDLLKRVQIVEQMMDMHINALQELGISLALESGETADASATPNHGLLRNSVFVSFSSFLK